MGSSFWEVQFQFQCLLEALHLNTHRKNYLRGGFLNTSLRTQKNKKGEIYIAYILDESQRTFSGQSGQKSVLEEGFKTLQQLHRKYGCQCLLSLAFAASRSDAGFQTKDGGAPMMFSYRGKSLELAAKEMKGLKLLITHLGRQVTSWMMTADSFGNQAAGRTTERRLAVPK